MPSSKRSPAEVERPAARSLVSYGQAGGTASTVSPGASVKIPVVRHQRESEPQRSSGDPAVGVVVALAEGVPDPLAVGAELRVDQYEFRPGVDGLRLVDPCLEPPASGPGPTRVAAPQYRSSAAVWNEMNAGRPTMIGS